MSRHESDLVGSDFLDTHVGRGNRDVGYNTGLQVCCHDFTSLFLIGNQLRQFFILINEDLEIATIFDLAGGLKVLHLEPTIRFQTNSVEIIAALEGNRRTGRVERVELHVFRGQLIATKRFEETLCDNLLVIKVKVIRVEDLHKTTKFHRDRNFYEDGPLR